MIMDIYEKSGWPNRFTYLEWLAEEYDTDLSTVLLLSEILGKEEDFDDLSPLIEIFSKAYDTYESSDGKHSFMFFSDKKVKEILKKSQLVKN